MPESQQVKDVQSKIEIPRVLTPDRALLKTSPLDLLSALVVVGLDGLDQLGERGPVVRVHVGDGDAGGGLAAAHSPKPGQFNFSVISCSTLSLIKYPV